MAKPKKDSSSAAAAQSPARSTVWAAVAALLAVILVPVVASVVFYQPHGFNPVAFPADYTFGPSVAIPERHDRVLGESERVGEGLLQGPEDLAFDAGAGIIYTGCDDGWIRRVRLDGDDAKVEDWVHVGGRPLGVALGPDGSLVVAEAHKGLMIVRPNKAVDFLVDEAEGLKFLLIDGVDVASDHIIYFTDASYKYTLSEDMLDIFEGRPHGRLISFNPSTNQTSVLLRDLYFANGVTLSPDERSLIFCETVVRRCSRYYLRGEKKGGVERFIDNLPGFPDNIRYDGEGHYWIALASGRSFTWDCLQKFPIFRKILVGVGRFVKLYSLLGRSGVLGVTLDGKPLALYSDPDLYIVTSGLKIGKHLYYGSLKKPYISRIVLDDELAKPQ